MNKSKIIAYEKAQDDLVDMYLDDLIQIEGDEIKLVAFGKLVILLSEIYHKLKPLDISATEKIHMIFEELGKGLTNDHVKKVNGIFTLNIIQETNEPIIYTIDLKHSPPTVKLGTVKKPDTTLEMSSNTLVDWINC
jgi:hypothetical protein